MNRVQHLAILAMTAGVRLWIPLVFQDVLQRLHHQRHRLRVEPERAADDVASKHRLADKDRADLPPTCRILSPYLVSGLDYLAYIDEQVMWIIFRHGLIFEFELVVKLGRQIRLFGGLAGVGLGVEFVLKIVLQSVRIFVCVMLGSDASQLPGEAFLRIKLDPVELFPEP